MKNIGLRLFVLGFAAVAALAAKAAPFAYITEASGSIAIIDAERRDVIARLPVGGSPFGIAVNPLGARAFVTNTTRAEVSVIDTAARGVIAHIGVASDPYGIVINPANTRVFVVHDSPASPTSSVTVINTENHQLITSVAVGAGARRIAMDVHGNRVFVANTRGNSISVLNATSYSTIATIATPDGPQGMWVDPTGKRLYVAHFGNFSPGNSLSVIDLDSNTVVASVGVGVRPDSIVGNPAGTRLFVSNRTSNNVSIIDARNLTVTATVSVGQGPAGIDITPEADFVYVANQDSGTVSVLHAEIVGVFHTIPAGPGPWGVGRFFAGTSPSATPAGILSGLWWNPAESGWGIHLTQRRDTIFAAWFTYDGIGAPHWYVASSCSMSQPLTCPTCVEGAFCSGSLFEVNGPRFFGDRFEPGAVSTTNVGVLQLEFRNQDSATMSYVVGNRTRTVAISRQVFQAGSTAPAISYTDLWWNPNESGWGLGITQQFGMMFLTWFVYEDTGRPAWFVASSCVVNPSNTGCRGTLYRTQGPPGPVASNTFDPSMVRATAAGTIDVTFTDANNGMISYTVGNISGSKAITRQIF